MKLPRLFNENFSYDGTAMLNKTLCLIDKYVDNKCYSKVTFLH